MATRSKLLAILNGLHQEVDLSVDQLIVDSLQVGGFSGTVLTKTILDSLIASSGSAITSLTGDVTGTGPGATATTVAKIQGTTISGTTGTGNVMFSASPTTTGTLTAAAISASGTITGSNLSGTNTGDQTITLTGDVTGSGTSSFAATVAKIAGTTVSGTTGSTNVVFSASPTLTGTVAASAISMSGNIAMGGNKVTGLGAPTANGDALRYDQLGANNGIATLDSGGKVPVSQLPNSVMEFQGTWNASTNSPTLADGTGNTGDVYRVNVAGTQDLGSGSQTFVVGDFVIYNGTIWQLAHAGADAVVSVNGAAGVVTVNAINQLTGDVTTTAASGSQSKAATIAAIAGTTVSGTTGTGNVMFSASPTTTGTLTAAAISASGTITGSNLSGTNTGDQTITLTGDVTGSGTGSFSATIASNSVTASKIATSAFDGTTITGGGGSAAAVQYAPMVKKTMVAGEAMAANTSFLVRMAVSGETSGRVYKATNANAATDGKFYALGIALKTSAVSAGDALDVVFMGSYTLGSSDTAFASGDIGKAVYLTTAGGFSVTAPSASGAAVYRIGVVETTTKIWVDSKQLNGILA